MNDLFGYADKKEGKSCHTKHKPLEFGDGLLLGASCSSPRSGYDIYIGLDWGMSFNHTAYPWQTDDDSVTEFLFRISDMGVPQQPKLFKEMVDWICTQLHAGKKIHVGCIGGHGRTGMVIAAVKTVWDGEKDSITWAREHHCQKAVESVKQVIFLKKHFGIKRVGGAKYDFFRGNHKKASQRKAKFQQQSSKVVTLKTVSCLKGKGSIWG